MLHMMLTNILNAQVQAIDLRFLQRRVLRALSRIFTEHGVQVGPGAGRVSPGWLRSGEV